MSVSAAELAERTRRRQGVRIDARLAERFLSEWLERGVVEEVVPGRFRLSRSGEAMFAGWVGVVELEESGPAPPMAQGGVSNPRVPGVQARFFDDTAGLDRETLSQERGGVVVAGVGEEIDDLEDGGASDLDSRELHAVEASYGDEERAA